MKKILAILAVISFFCSLGLSKAQAYSGEQANLAPLTQAERDALQVKVKSHLNEAWTIRGTRWVQDVDLKQLNTYLEKQGGSWSKNVERFRKKLRLHSLYHVNMLKAYFETNDALKKTFYEHRLNGHEKIVEINYGFNIFKSLIILKTEKNAFLAEMNRINKKPAPINKAW